MLALDTIAKTTTPSLFFMWPSATVIKVLGVSQRQLDYWEQIGLIRATANEKRGSRELTRTGRLEQRLYRFEDFRDVKVVKKLRDAGLSLQRIQKAVAELRRKGMGLKDVLIVTDGKRIEWIREDGKVQRLLDNGQMVFAAVAIKRIEEELRKELNTDKRGRPLATGRPRRARAS